MQIRIISLGLLCSTMAIAGESGIKSIANQAGYRPLVTLQGGFAGVRTGQALSFLGDDSITFSYFPQKKNNDVGFIGGFAGLEHTLPYYNLFAQLGLEYNYFSPYEVTGLHTAGIEPSTSTLYRYNYHQQTQQLLATAKLLARSKGRIHPYLSAGLGAAFNNLTRYTAQTAETGNINLRPLFQNKRSSNFSYNLGLGADADLNQNWRIGLGYRFSDFGKASLGQGHLGLNNFVTPVAFTLQSSHTYANQLIGHLSYLA